MIDKVSILIYNLYMSSYTKWYKWVDQAKKRDDYKCRKCGKTDKESYLIVHHIDESRKTGKLNNKLSNLLTLCRPCHAREHGQVSNRQDIFELIAAGYPVGFAARKLGISRQWAYHLVNRQKDTIDKQLSV